MKNKIDAPKLDNKCLNKITRLMLYPERFKFNSILKYYNMSQKLDSKTFWLEFQKIRDNNCQLPTFVSIHQCRRHYGFNDFMLKRLYRDGLIRASGTPSKYALEDVIIMSELRDVITKAEKVEIQGNVIYRGKNKYRIIDMSSKKITINEYQLEVFKSAFDGWFGRIYEKNFHIISKELSLEKKVEILKNESLT